MLEVTPEGPEAAKINKELQRLAHVAEVLEKIAKIKPDLDKAEGVERAKLLDQLTDLYPTICGFPSVFDKGKGPNENDIGAAKNANRDAWSKEIISLDAENKAGLKNKYLFDLLSVEASKLIWKGKLKEGEAAFDKAIALKGIPPERLQDAYHSKAIFLASENGNDPPKALEYSRKSLALALALKGVSPETLLEAYRCMLQCMGDKPTADQEAEALDYGRKVLAFGLKGSPEQLQAAFGCMAKCHMFRNEKQEALDYFKNALAAAPQAPLADEIKGEIKDCEMRLKEEAKDSSKNAAPKKDKSKAEEKESLKKG